MEKENMQHWEYQTAYLMASMTFTKGNRWRLCEINEQMQPGWRKSEPYVSIADFCNHMGQQGWELVSTMHPGRSPLEVTLYFKRPRQSEWKNV